MKYMDHSTAASDAHGSRSLMSTPNTTTTATTTTTTTASPSASPPEGPHHPSKRRRTASSLSDCCRTCRLRKVKCSGNPGNNGPCSNCARLELTCPFTNPELPFNTQGKVSRTTPSHSHTEAGTIRKRAQRACSQCHAHKTKCSGDLPRCKRCEAAGLNCEYTPAKRKFANVRFSTSNPRIEESHPSSQVVLKSEDASSPIHGSNAGHFPLAIDTSAFIAEDLLFRKNILLKHMNAYFDHIYYMPCMGFFHPETTYAQIQDGTLDPATAAAMVATSSFFVDPSDAGREFAMKCSDEVEFHVFRNIYRFDEATLILYALNCLFNFLNGSLAKVNWDVLSQNRTFVQQECLRRIVWQFYYMDRLLAGGYEEYISCRDEIMKIRLPCNESAFRSNTPVVVERLHDKSPKSNGAMGIHGYQLKIIDIRHRILIMTRKLGATPGPSRTRVEPSKVMADINTLQNELSRFNASLPDELKLNDQNVTRYMASEEGPGYVFLHTCLGSSHLDLYSLSLPGLREQISVDILRKLPREFISKSQKQAIAHALCLARFCDTIQREVDQRPGTGRLKLAGDPSILNVTNQVLRVLLTALQHHFYQDLADHTTAPLWRSEPADEAHIRNLIDSLLRISESWCRIIPKARHYHDSNRAAVEQFNRTRKFADQKTHGGPQSIQATGSGRLPGPHHILENAFVDSARDEQRSKAGDAAAADRWFRTPQPSNEPVAYPLPGGEFDIEYGPPGVPMFLAQARGVSLASPDNPNLYDAANDLLSMSSKMMPVSDFGGMMPPGNPLGLAPDTIPLLHIDGTGDAGMFQPQQPPPHPQFLPPQQGMFVDSYGQYTDTQPDSTTYMPQSGFG